MSKYNIDEQQPWKAGRVDEKNIYSVKLIEKKKTI